VLSVTRLAPTQHLYDVPIAWVPFDQASRRLLETPTLPERFHPKPEAKEPVRLTSSRASALHKELGKLETVASSEHHRLAAEALGRAVGHLHRPHRSGRTFRAQPRQAGGCRAQARGAREPRAAGR